MEKVNIKGSWNKRITPDQVSYVAYLYNISVYIKYNFWYFLRNLESFFRKYFNALQVPNHYVYHATAVQNVLDSGELVITFQEADAEALPFAEASFDVTVACTVLEEGDADRMLAELARVTKPGGRVAVITRAIDMDWWVNLPLPAELRRKINALGPGTGAGVGEHGCADASLYRRLSQAGLARVAKSPQFAIYAEGERVRSVLDRLVAPLPPEQVQTCREAMATAEAEGTLFVAEPFHRAVATKLN